MKTEKVAFTRGNTPLNTVPADYLPPGAEAQWLLLTEGPDAGKKLFFYDVVLGEGEPQATLFFVHGNPECSYTYRGTIDEVVKQSQGAVRIIAMDHIGFGLSDQASFEMVEYHHANNVKQLVTYLGVQEITLVIHDWGGAIGVGALIDTPDLVSHLVLMNTTIFPMPQEGDTYSNFPFPGPLSWTRLGHSLPWQVWKYVPPLVMSSPAGKLGFIAHCIKFGLRSLLGKLSEEDKMYRDMFKTEANARSSMRNVKQTGVWGHGYRYFDESEGWQDNHAFYVNMQEKIEKAWGPQGANIAARAFFGTFDPCGKASVRAQWLKALPQLQGHITLFENRGHFIEEHEPAAIAAGIVDILGAE